MPAVADIQNSIVKEFENDPRVETAVMSQNEPAATLETFWSNLYLRGRMIYDPDGAVALSYGHPATGLPASRAVVITPDMKIELPHFGHRPDLLVKTMYEVLAAIEDPLDLTLDRSPGGTRVCWNGQPGGGTYDVIRGQISHLGRLGPGIDLGVVTCVESASSDTCTTGNEDAEMPPSGDSFFYLVRYDDGTETHYGASSEGRLRVPLSGECP